MNFSCKILSTIIFLSLTLYKLKCELTCYESPLFHCEMDSIDSPIALNSSIQMNQFLIYLKNVTVLEKTFYIENIFNWNRSNYSKFDLLIDGLNGFDINANPFENLSKNRSDIDYFAYKIFESKISFYDNGRHLKNCNVNDYNVSHVYSLFPRLASEILFASDLIYPDEICSLIFNNIDIDLFLIEGLYVSYIKKRMFTIESNDIDLNSIVSKFTLRNVYAIRIDSSLLNYKVFKDLTELKIFGNIQSSIDFIDTEIFKDFKKLKTIFIQLRNFDEFFNKNVAWLTYINSEIFIKPEDGADFDLYFHRIFYIIMVQTSAGIIYTYPDEDFCLFTKFPINRLTIGFNIVENNDTCSCTILYLMQLYNYFSYQRKLDILKKFQNHMNSYFSVDI